MSSKLRQVWPSLELVSAIKTPKFRKQLLKHFSNDEQFCSACREISKNIVKRKFIIKGQKAKSLRRHKRIISSLSKKNNSKKRKRLLVSQSGGWLAAVIPLVATVIGELIRSNK